MPSLIGRRLTVFDVVTKIDIEDTLDEALEDYQITLSEAKAAIEYCMSLACKEDNSRLQFCDGCILRTIDEEWDFNRDEYQQLDDKLTISKDGQLTFFGTLDELEDETFGRPGWILAEKIHSKINDN